MKRSELEEFKEGLSKVPSIEEHIKHSQGASERGGKGVKRER